MHTLPTNRSKRPGRRGCRCRLLPDDVEVLIEMHVDLAPVIKRDFDFVAPLLVADLGLGDSSAASVGQCGRTGLFEGSACDGRVIVVVYEASMKRGTMDIQQLTDEMNRFVTAKGWYAPDSPYPQTPRNIATSIAVEAAEILEHFQFDDEARDRAALAGELADVALYLLQLAYLTGIDLEQAILDKLEQNYGRTWNRHQPYL